VQDKATKGATQRSVRTPSAEASMLEILTKLTAVSERGAFDGRNALALWTEMVASAPVSVQCVCCA
jgi:hypothetical protein